MNYALPSLYRSWMDEALGEPILSEPRADCANCVMCVDSKKPAANDYSFNPNTKCCSYHPTLPNYLIGAAIADNDPNFSEAKAQFIRGVLVAKISPMGISPPDVTQLLFKWKPFGKLERLLCPFYMPQDGGLCAIWKYRNARCSTWFCKHSRGRVGFAFWNALDEMLTFVEQNLAARFIDDLQMNISEKPADWREAIWGSWTYREHEFFLACWDKVQSLSWEQVLEIGGSELRLFAEKTKVALNQLHKAKELVPLRISNFKSEEVGDELVRIWSYSPFNPIDLPRKIVDVLASFDGRPLEIVLAELENEKGVRIDQKLLEQLTDYEILIPVERL
jgi:hypothetical protein